MGKPRFITYDPGALDISPHLSSTLQEADNYNAGTLSQRIFHVTIYHLLHPVLARVSTLNLQLLNHTLSLNHMVVAVMQCIFVMCSNFLAVGNSGAQAHVCRSSACKTRLPVT